MSKKIPSIIDTVTQTIDQYRLLTPGGCVLIGVSGGPDSVCLLDVLNKLRPVWGLTLGIAHINHHLRADAGKEQRFVEKLARQYALPLHVAHLKIQRTKGKSSLEEVAREKRFEKFLHIAKRIRADRIALAHHQDDLAETVLMRILRGTGLEGLQSIIPKRTFCGQTIIRPLIQISKADILAYLQKERLSYCLDSSNKDVSFYRNKIRLRLVPLLEKDYNPNIRATLANLAQTVSEDYQFLETQGQKAFAAVCLKKTKGACALNLRRLQELPLSLRRFVIRRAVEFLQGDKRRLTLQHIKEIESLLENRPVGSAVDLPRGIKISKAPTTLMFCLHRGY